MRKFEKKSVILRLRLLDKALFLSKKLRKIYAVSDYFKWIFGKNHSRIEKNNTAKTVPERTTGKSTMEENQDKNTPGTENMTEVSKASAAHKKGRIHLNIHLVLLAAITLVICVCALRLYLWNKGTGTDYDPSQQTTEFDIEVMDSIIPLAPELREGWTDDGVTTILCLGDDPFSLDRGEGGLSEQIAKKTGATVYNGSFTGTTMAAQYASYNDGYILDAFSFSYVANSLANGDFDLMKTAATYSYDESFSQNVQMLSELDMNAVDVICIMYDGSDYVNKRPCDDPNAPYDPVTYTGALRAGVKAIQEAYPHIRIAVMSHTFCHSINEEGNFQNGDRADLGHGTLSHYWQKERDAAMDVGVSFIDNFYGSVNEDNYLDYMTDYIHFNDAGRELLAQRFVDCIFPELTQQAEE